MADEQQPRYRLDDLVKEYGNSSDPKMRALVALAIHGANLLVALEKFALELNAINAQTAPDVNKFPAIAEVLDSLCDDDGKPSKPRKPAPKK